LTQVTGFVRTYSPEYRSFGTDEVMLRHLADAGGGRVLSDPAEAFARREGRDVPRTYTDVWPWLLGAAICLLPMDIGVRRLTFSFGGVCALKGVYDRASRRLRPARTRPSARMARLMAAKDRAPVGQESLPQEEVLAGAHPVTPLPGGDLPVEGEAGGEGGAVAGEAAPRDVHAGREPPELDVTDRGEMTSRLLAAKRRAGRRRDDEPR
jgi:hypothetical protein